LPKGSWSVDEDMKNPFVTVKPVEINYTNPTRISEINWGKRSVRIINELTAHNINNLGELLNLSRSDVLMFKNIGRVALMCIVDTLAEMNLQLKEEINV
jgi:DNA-directed RNA polymerase alpha subunit